MFLKTEKVLSCVYRLLLPPLSERRVDDTVLFALVLNDGLPFVLRVLGRVSSCFYVCMDAKDFSLPWSKGVDLFF